MSGDESGGMNGDNIIRDPRLLGTERAGALSGGNGGGGGHMLETRVAKLESDVEYIKRDVAELRSDTKQLSKDVGELKADMKLLVERTGHLATTASVYNLGLSLAASVVVIVLAIVGFAPKLWQVLGTAPTP